MEWTKAKKRHDEDLPILERIKTIVPPIDEVAVDLQAEHQAAARIRKLMLIIHAGIVELGEHVNQLALESGDIANAQADLASTQRVHMEAMEQLADRNAGARTVIQNQDVFLRSDPVSIAHVLQIVDSGPLTEAARHLEEERVFELIEALANSLKER